MSNSTSKKQISGQVDNSSFKEMSMPALMTQLDTSADGLSGTEAQQRLEKYGYNEIEEKKQSPILKFLSYFWGPIPIMIIIAAILSGVLRHWPDVGVILVLLLMNAVVGFREEYQADSAIAALKKRLALKARVKRDGEWSSIAARELVPGDITRLRIGDVIPADSKLLEGDPVQVVTVTYDEAMDPAAGNPVINFTATVGRARAGRGPMLDRARAPP